jgi:hypothetical protein
VRSKRVIPSAALNRVALRDDAPALALRGIAMVKHGRFPERDPMSVGDRAYDSDPLDEELRRDGMEMIAPHHANLGQRQQVPSCRSRSTVAPSGLHDG